MGLTSFSGTHPRKSEVAIAKNYLTESELKRLNTLVSAYFEAAEFRAQSHEPTFMQDWIGHLDRMIAAIGGQSLTGAGTRSHLQAKAKAEGEYDAYRAGLDASGSAVEAAYLDSLRQAQHQIERKRP